MGKVPRVSKIPEHYVRVFLCFLIVVLAFASVKQYNGLLSAKKEFELYKGINERMGNPVYERDENYVPIPGKHLRTVELGGINLGTNRRKEKVKTEERRH